MGKTTFTQGLAQGLGITSTITSPTFTLLKEYAGQVRQTQDKHTKGPALYHFDLYRLDDPEEIFDLGFEDYFYDTTGVCVIEWAEKADGLWIPETLRIAIKIQSETERLLVFTAIGTRYHELLRQFQKNTYAITRT
jgi:tRNA threonylcarbamoyladenosine biosynthesis protein TsaE